MIHVFHGFLGSPEDFSFLMQENVILHNLYELNELPSVKEDDVLIGYSMGGRIALEIAHQHAYHLKKIVLINAHPGLSSEEARLQRLSFETKVLQELQNNSKDRFLAWWNSLPIFNSDGPITVSDKIFEKSSDLFHKYRLSQQKDYLPQMIENKEKVLYIVGLNDEKYMELVSELLLPVDLLVKGIAGGHRLFQNQQELRSLLVTEGVL